MNVTSDWEAYTIARNHVTGIIRDAKSNYYKHVFNQNFNNSSKLWKTLKTVAEFRSFVMNNKAFGNLFCNSQKSFHTSPGSYDSNNRGYRSFFNSTQQWHLHLQKILHVNFFVNAIVEFEERSIASIIRVARSRGGVKTFL